MFTPTIKLEHADSRGEIYSIDLGDDRELMLLHSTPGSFRGGHSHSCDEIIILLSGSMRYFKRYTDDRPDDSLNGEHTEGLGHGSTSFNRAGVIHMGEFLEDSWVLEFKFAKKGEWTQQNYEPYREQVRASIKD